MLKGLVVTILATVIFCSLVFVILKSSLLLAPEGALAMSIRNHLAPSPVMRNMFGLHYDGDAKSDYLGEKYSNILVEVDFFGEGQNYRNQMEALAEKIEAATGKHTQVLMSSRISALEDTLSDQELLQQKKLYQNQSSGGEKAIFYVLIVSLYQEEPELIGRTLEEDGVAVFLDAIDALGSGRDEIIISTLLHEFGHQLGLPHNSESRCLMNEQLEVGGASRYQPDDFCAFEQKQISLIKQSINNN